MRRVGRHSVGVYSDICVVARSNSRRRVVLRGCGKLQGAIFSFLATCICVCHRVCVRVSISACMCVRLITFGEQMMADDVTTNVSLARHGADIIEKTCRSSSSQLTMLTHCNTGSLATAGYGTALGL